MTSRLRALLRVFTLAALAVLATSALPAAKAEAECIPGPLASKLKQIRAKFGPVQVISTFRKGATIAGSGRPSLHASCRAVDFNPPKGKYNQVLSWLKANHGGGVGSYSCGMHHIHIDTGPKLYFHRCQSASNGSGRQARKQVAAANWKKNYSKQMAAKAFTVYAMPKPVKGQRIASAN